jgi:Flp pilus assembly protein TadG
MRILKRTSLSNERSGVSAVEVAMVAPVAFLLIIGLMIGGSAVFRYQQLSSLAHEGARWASLHGKISQGSNLPTAADVMKNAILPMTVSMDKDRMTCQLSRDPSGRIVVVTLNYEWIPEGYLDAGVMTATAQMPVLY